MKFKIILILLIVGLLVVVMADDKARTKGQSKNSKGKKHSKRIAKMTNINVKPISVEELKEWIDEGKDFVLVDVREDQEVAMGVIGHKNFKHLPIRSLEDMVSKKGALKGAKVVAVYCLIGGRSSMAANSLKKLGFKEVYNVTGGIKAWMSAGYSTKKNLN